MEKCEINLLALKKIRMTVMKASSLTILIRKGNSLDYETILLELWNLLKAQMDQMC